MNSNRLNRFAKKTYYFNGADLKAYLDRLNPYILDAFHEGHAVNVETIDDFINLCMETLAIADDDAFDPEKDELD